MTHIESTLACPLCRSVNVIHRVGGEYAFSYTCMNTDCQHQWMVWTGWKDPLLGEKNGKTLWGKKDERVEKETRELE